VDDAGKVYLDTPQALQAAQWLVNFSRYAPATASYDICKNMFLSAKAAAFWTGLYAIPEIQAANIDFGIIPMGRPFVTVNVMMITQDAVNRSAAQAALDVMKFFTNAQNAEKLALAGNVVPANTAALNSPAVSANPLLSGFGAAVAVGVAMATTPYSNAQWGPVASAATDIWTGKQQPAAALAAAQKAIEDAIAGMK
jgi:arabinogalactan oligomer/maltooligosaccharide transport system substrate-binding protein